LDTSGKAYIYNLDNGQLIKTINNPNATAAFDSPGDRFGNKISMYGAYIAISSYDEGGTDTGVVYVYNTSGTLLRTITPPSTSQFGIELKLYNSKLAISDNSTSVRTVRIYDASNGSLLLSIPDPTSTGNQGDGFGHKLAMQGNYIAIADQYRSKVYIFNVNSGSLIRTFDNPSLSSTIFARSVAQSESYTIIGGDNCAYVFDTSSGVLLSTIAATDSTNNIISYGSFGVSMDITMSNDVIVGANVQGDTSSDGSGKAYLYNINNL
jgi:outer membrane protein assembly factor BamB